MLWIFSQQRSEHFKTRWAVPVASIWSHVSRRCSKHVCLSSNSIWARRYRSEHDSQWVPQKWYFVQWPCIEAPPYWGTIEILDKKAWKSRFTLTEPFRNHYQSIRNQISDRYSAVEVSITPMELWDTIFSFFCGFSEIFFQRAQRCQRRKRREDLTNISENPTKIENLVSVPSGVLILRKPPLQTAAWAADPE